MDMSQHDPCLGKEHGCCFLFCQCASEYLLPNGAKLTTVVCGTKFVLGAMCIQNAMRNWSMLLLSVAERRAAAKAELATRLCKDVTTLFLFCIHKCCGILCHEDVDTVVLWCAEAIGVPQASTMHV